MPESPHAKEAPVLRKSLGQSQRLYFVHTPVATRIPLSITLLVVRWMCLYPLTSYFNRTYTARQFWRSVCVCLCMHECVCPLHTQVKPELSAVPLTARGQMTFFSLLFPLSFCTSLPQPCHLPSKHRNILIRELCAAVSKGVKSIWMEFQAQQANNGRKLGPRAGWSSGLLSDRLLKELAPG